MPNKSKPALKQFTVIGKKRVFRIAAKSIQQLTRALREVGIVWQAIHEDVESTPANLKKRFS